MNDWLLIWNRGTAPPHACDITCMVLLYTGIPGMLHMLDELCHYENGWWRSVHNPAFALCPNNVAFWARVPGLHRLTPDEIEESSFHAGA